MRGRWVGVWLLVATLSTYGASAVAADNQPNDSNGGNLDNPAGWTDWSEVRKLRTGETVKPEQEARRDALTDFKRGAGLGISVAIGSRQDSIEEASILNGRVVVTRRAKDQPRAALEVHQLLTTNIFTQKGRDAARDALDACAANPVNCPFVGIGPFAAIQTGDSDSIASVGIGLMLGLRTDPRQGSSFNIGLGLAFDGRTRELARGFVEGEAPPEGATEVKLSDRSHRRLLLNLSFSF